MAVSVERALCADISSAGAEPLAATASHVCHWILVEYRGLWDRDVLGGSLLSARVKAHLRAQLAALPRSRLLFVRQPERRGLDGRAVFLVRSDEPETRLLRLEIDDHEDLLELDLARVLNGHSEARATALEQPLFVVCTHGKRDRCCAKYGHFVYDELRNEVDPAWVWQATHVGGDRFAGNVVCFPEGLCYGRVASGDAERLVRAHRAGELYLERFRGRSSHPFPVQAAEHAVREATGLAGIGEVRSLRHERTGEGAWRVRLAAGGRGEEHEVEVVEELSDEAVYLTCNAVAPRHVRRFVAAEHRVVTRP